MPGSPIPRPLKTPPATPRKARENGWPRQARHCSSCNRILTVAVSWWPLGIETVPDPAIDTLLEELSGRLRAWQSRAARKLEIERQIAELSSDLRRLDGLVESANAALAGRTQRLEVLTREREEQAARRQELFGERDPGAEEQ